MTRQESRALSGSRGSPKGVKVVKKSVKKATVLVVMKVSLVHTLSLCRSLSAAVAVSLCLPVSLSAVLQYR